jgi:hypothetical protein
MGKLKGMEVTDDMGNPKGKDDFPLMGKDMGKGSVLPPSSYSISSSVQDDTLPKPGETEEPEKEAPKARKTRFDPTKFIINPTMSNWLTAKYPEFQQGDIDYMVTKFVGVFTGAAKSDWPRTFYTFVDNEVIKYNYRPGQWDWRNNNGKSHQGANVNEQRIAEQRSIVEKERAGSEGGTGVSNGSVSNRPTDSLLSPNDDD